MASKTGKYCPGVRLNHTKGASKAGAQNGGNKGSKGVPQSSAKPVAKLPKR